MKNIIKFIIKSVLNLLFGFKYGWPCNGKENWSIGIYTGNSPLNPHPPENNHNPVITANDITDRTARFVADPFMVQKESTWYMFFEALNSKTWRGEIGLATSEDGLKWRYKQIILSESFHLSYPYVFEDNDAYYMIPESQHADSIRLYKATEFPTQWTLIKILINGQFVDPTIFKYSGKWWLFATNSKNDTLRLFYTGNLFDPWVEHPKSPLIKRNNHIARSGGRIILFNNKIYRYSQDDFLVYGNKVYAFEITKLSTTEYEEKKVKENPILKRSGMGWNAKGMHTIDPHYIGNHQWLFCVDGLDSGECHQEKKENES